jgi:cobalt-zinc-cadmium efflux system protein
VLLEATPAGIDAREVRLAMAQVPGVNGVHDLHIWTVTSGLVALSAHIECSSESEWNPMLVDLAALLNERFGIVHVTLQPEMGNLPAALAMCTLDTPEGRAACLSHRSAVEHESNHEHAHVD